MEKLFKIRQVRYTEVVGLGRRIRSARLAYCLKSGRTLQSLCEEVGIDRSYWSAVERESVRPNGALHLKTLAKMERVLNVNFGISEADLVEE